MRPNGDDFLVGHALLGGFQFFFFFGRKDVSFLSINKKTNYVLLLFLNTTEVWFGDNVEAKHYT